MANVSKRETVRQATQAMLQSERSVATVLRVFDHAAQQAAIAMEQTPGWTTLACAAGCFFCCYHPVDITPPEALALVAHLHATFLPEALAAMQARIAAQAATIHGMSFEAHAQAKLPCALLVNGICSVYAHRPLACRAWHSTSVARCETIHVEGDPVTMIPPLDMDAYDTVWEVARGVTDGCQHIGLDAKLYELHSIVRHALETPDAAERWLRGDDVFVSCTIGAFTT